MGKTLRPGEKAARFKRALGLIAKGATVPQAARAVGVHRTSLQRWLRADDLPAPLVERATRARVVSDPTLGTRFDIRHALTLEGDALAIWQDERRAFLSRIAQSRAAAKAGRSGNSTRRTEGNGVYGIDQNQTR